MQYPKKNIVTAVLTILYILIATALPIHAKESKNLIINPDWAEGTKGWVIESNERVETEDGNELFCTRVFQDISLKNLKPGQILKLSCKIAVDSEDKTQESVCLGMETYSSDETMIQNEYREEFGTDLKDYKIREVVSGDAAFVRVVLSINKRDAQENTFCFKELSLVVEGTPFEIEPGPAEEDGLICIYSNINYEEAENGPQEYLEMSLNKTEHIGYITTFHWNDGHGAEPGYVTVYEDGLPIGTWYATGRSCAGVKNVFWDIKTDFKMTPGRYYSFVDSSNSTWSFNSASEGFGMLALYCKDEQEFMEYKATRELRYFNIKITIDKIEILPKDKNDHFVEPFLVGDNIYMPYQVVAGLLGMEASYSEKSNTIRLTKGRIPEGTYEDEIGHYETVKAEVTYRNTSVTLNGKTIELKDIFGSVIYPFEYENEIYFPIESLEEYLDGVEMIWIDSTSTLNIKTRDDPVPDVTATPIPTPEPDPPDTGGSTDETSSNGGGTSDTGTHNGTNSGTTNNGSGNNGADNKTSNNGKSQSDEKGGTQTVEVTVTPPLSDEEKPTRQFSLKDYMGCWAHENPKGDGSYMEVAMDCVSFYDETGFELKREVRGFCSLSETGDLLFYEEEYKGREPQPYILRLRLEDYDNLRCYRTAEGSETASGEPYNRVENPDIGDFMGRWQLYTMDWDGIFIELSDQTVSIYSQDDEKLMSKKTGRFYYNKFIGLLQFIEGGSLKSSLNSFYLRADFYDEDDLTILYTDDKNRKARADEYKIYTREVAYDLSPYAGKWQHETEENNGKILEITEEGLTYYSPTDGKEISRSTGTYSCDARMQDLLFYENGHGSVRFRLEGDRRIRAYYRDTGEEAVYVRLDEEIIDLSAFMGTWIEDTDYEIKAGIKLSLEEDRILLLLGQFEEDTFIELRQATGTYVIDPDTKEIKLVFDLSGNSPVEEGTGKLEIRLKDSEHLVMGNDDGSKTLVRLSEPLETATNIEQTYGSGYHPTGNEKVMPAHYEGTLTWFDQDGKIVTGSAYASLSLSGDSGSIYIESYDAGYSFLLTGTYSAATGMLTEEKGAACIYASMDFYQDETASPFSAQNTGVMIDAYEYDESGKVIAGFHGVAGGITGVVDVEEDDQVDIEISFD